MYNNNINNNYSNPYKKYQTEQRRFINNSNYQNMNNNQNLNNNRIYQQNINNNQNLNNNRIYQQNRNNNQNLNNNRIYQQNMNNNQNLNNNRIYQQNRNNNQNLNNNRIYQQNRNNNQNLNNNHIYQQNRNNNQNFNFSNFNQQLTQKDKELANEIVKEAVRNEISYMQKAKGYSALNYYYYNINSILDGIQQNETKFNKDRINKAFIRYFDLTEIIKNKNLSIEEIKNTVEYKERENIKIGMKILYFCLNLISRTSGNAYKFYNMLCAIFNYNINVEDLYNNFLAVFANIPVEQKYLIKNAIDTINEKILKITNKNINSPSKEESEKINKTTIEDFKRKAIRIEKEATSTFIFYYSIISSCLKETKNYNNANIIDAISKKINDIYRKNINLKGEERNKIKNGMKVASLCLSLYRDNPNSEQNKRMLKAIASREIEDLYADFDNVFVTTEFATKSLIKQTIAYINNIAGINAQQNNNFNNIPTQDKIIRSIIEEFKRNSINIEKNYMSTFNGYCTMILACLKEIRNKNNYDILDPIEGKIKDINKKYESFNNEQNRKQFENGVKIASFCISLYKNKPYSETTLKMMNALANNEIIDLYNNFNVVFRNLTYMEKNLIINTMNSINVNINNSAPSIKNIESVINKIKAEIEKTNLTNIMHSEQKIKELNKKIYSLILYLAPNKEIKNNLQMNYAIDIKNYNTLSINDKIIKNSFLLIKYGCLLLIKENILNQNQNNQLLKILANNKIENLIYNYESIFTNKDIRKIVTPIIIKSIENNRNLMNLMQQKITNIENNNR